MCLTCGLVYVGVDLKSMTSTAGSDRDLTVHQTSASEQVNVQLPFKQPTKTQIFRCRCRTHLLPECLPFTVTSTELYVSCF